MNMRSLVLSCMLAFMGMGITGAARAADAGRVSGVVGGVSIQRGDDVIDVKQGTVLMSGDRLITGSDGRVQWRTADEAILVLVPNSRFVIEQYTGEGDAGLAHYKLDTGRFGTLSGAIQSPGYRVVTPMGDIGIEGTQYKSAVCKGDCKGLADGLYIMVVAGLVTASNAVGSVQGKPGQYIFVANRTSAPVFVNGPLNIFLSFDLNIEVDVDGLPELIIERPFSPS